MSSTISKHTSTSSMLACQTFRSLYERTVGTPSVLAIAVPSVPQSLIPSPQPLFFGLTSEDTRRRCFVLVILLGGMGVSGCLSHDGLNVNCEWTESGRAELDLTRGADQQHLSRDVDKAIEIAVRSADAEHGRRTGFPTNGGSVDFGRFREGASH